MTQTTCEKRPIYNILHIVAIVDVTVDLTLTVVILYTRAWYTKWLTWFIPLTFDSIFGDFKPKRLFLRSLDRNLKTSDFLLWPDIDLTRDFNSEILSAF